MNTSKESIEQDKTMFHLRRVVVILCFLFLFYLIFMIARPFLSPLLWSVVIALSTFKLYRRLLILTRGRQNLASLLMVFIIGSSILGILLPLAFELSGELTTLGQSALTQLHSEDFRKTWEESPLKHLPLGDVAEIKQQLADLVVSYQSDLLSALGVAVLRTGRILGTVIICLFSLFFLYRDGKSLVKDLRRLVERFFGPQAIEVLGTFAGTIQGTVYGIVATALAQSALATSGFLIFGAPLPVLLGSTVFVLSIIPFGPPILYIPLCLHLYFQGHSWQAIGLLIWCVSLVSTADNILRTVFVAQSTNMPLLLVLIGLIGGALAFGFIGLFIGPAVIAAGTVIWRNLFKD